MSYRITVISGDGVSSAKTDLVLNVLEAMNVAVVWDRFEIGEKAVESGDMPLPEGLIKSIKKNRVALNGNVGAFEGEEYSASTMPAILLRKALGLYASVRPIKNIPGLKSRFDDIDLVVVRENTEDVYAGIEHEVVPNVVESLKVVTEQACTRIANFAFDYAVKNQRRLVTLVHKANIMKVCDGLFIECTREVANNFSEIEYKEIIVDNACMQLAQNPYQFDVLLMGNLYGDIISDLCAGLVGGISSTLGINVGENIHVFEALHAEGTELEGKDLANPLSLLIPAVYMLKHIGEGYAADIIMKSVSAVITDGKWVTRDLGGNAKTSEMVKAIIDGM